jgi:hypothetical protein
MRKNTWIIVLLAIIVIALIAAVVVLYNRNEKSNEQTIVGGDEDEHGCIGSAGYSWCEAKDKCLRTWEEYCGSEDLDGVFDFMLELKSAAGVQFDTPAEVMLNWRTAQGSKEISGLEYVIENVHADTEKKIQDYFSNNGFIVDVNNVAGGVIGSLTGYVKGDLVCLESYALTDFTENDNAPITVNSDLRNITVQCGLNLAVNFSKTGNITNFDTTTGMESQSWRFLYEEPGKPAISVLFLPIAQCEYYESQDGEGINCADEEFYNGQRVSVDGNLENNILKAVKVVNVP